MEIAQPPNAAEKPWPAFAGATKVNLPEFVQASPDPVDDAIVTIMRRHSHKPRDQGRARGKVARRTTAA